MNQIPHPIRTALALVAAAFATAVLLCTGLEIWYVVNNAALDDNIASMIFAVSTVMLISCIVVGTTIHVVASMLHARALWFYVLCACLSGCPVGVDAAK
jgi:hypothetical protein